MLAGEDKLYHILACASITIVAFFVLVILQKSYQTCCCKSEEVSIGSGGDDVDIENNVPVVYSERKYFIIAIISGFISLSIGVAKEIADAYNLLWKGGQSSWADILADFIGVVIGLLIIFLALLGLRFWHLRNAS